MALDTFCFLIDGRYFSFLDEVKMRDRVDEKGFFFFSRKHAEVVPPLSDVHPALLHDGRHPLLILPLVFLVQLRRLAVRGAVGVGLVQ